MSLMFAEWDRPMKRLLFMIGHYHRDYDNDCSSVYEMITQDHFILRALLKRHGHWVPEGELMIRQIVRCVSGEGRHSEDGFVVLCNSLWIMSLLMFHEIHTWGQTKRVSETFVPVVTSTSMLSGLSRPEGATGLFEHYIVNENGKQIRSSDFKANEHERMCVTSVPLKLCMCTFISLCVWAKTMSFQSWMLLISLWNAKGDFMKKLLAALFHTMVETRNAMMTKFWRIIYADT